MMSADFLTELAQARPDPGGGAAAAYGARAALALLLKVVRLELARPQRDAAESRFWGELAAQAQESAAALLRLQQQDVQAYFGLTQARQAGNPEELAAAVRTAVDVPRCIMQEAGAALKILAAAGGGCKKHLVSDLLVVGELLSGALRGAYHIGAANLPRLAEFNEREDLAGELTRTLQAAEAQYRQTRDSLLRR